MTTDIQPASKTAAPTPLGHADTRRQFEQWATLNGWAIKQANGSRTPKYPEDTQCAWRGYQAAAEHFENIRVENIILKDALASLQQRITDYDAVLDDPRADGSGDDARPPEGDDYNNLFSTVRETIEHVDAYLAARVAWREAHTEANRERLGAARAAFVVSTAPDR